jgi:hypothetical protein
LKISGVSRPAANATVHKSKVVNVKLKTILCAFVLGLVKIKIGNKYKGALEICNGKYNHKRSSWSWKEYTIIFTISIIMNTAHNHDNKDLLNSFFTLLGGD